MEKTYSSSKTILTFTIIIMLVATIGCGTISGMKGGTVVDNRPSISIAPVMAEYKSGVEVLISGSGFEPKQKLGLYVNLGGVPSGIHFMLKPAPVPNEFGAFASVWRLRREVSKKLMEPFPKAYTLAVEDADGNILCTAPLLFCNPKEKDKFPCILIK